MIDIGCGAGLIAKTFLEYGAEEAYWVDGGYIDRRYLQLDEAFFTAHDLTQPFVCERRHDLAISLEVAEHLESKYAARFIKTLCNLSDVALFFPQRCRGRAAFAT